MDTVDANRALGLPDDCREYYSVRNIIADLGVKSIQLIVRQGASVVVGWPIDPVINECPGLSIQL